MIGVNCLEVNVPLGNSSFIWRPYSFRGVFLAHSIQCLHLNLEILGSIPVQGNFFLSTFPLVFPLHFASNIMIKDCLSLNLLIRHSFEFQRSIINGITKTYLCIFKTSEVHVFIMLYSTSKLISVNPSFFGFFSFFFFAFNILLTEQFNVLSKKLRIHRQIQLWDLL